MMTLFQECLAEQQMDRDILDKRETTSADSDMVCLRACEM